MRSAVQSVMGDSLHRNSDAAELEALIRAGQSTIIIIRPRLAGWAKVNFGAQLDSELTYLGLDRYFVSQRQDITHCIFISVITKTQKPQSHVLDPSIDMVSDHTL